ncbi:hypothetical protein ACWGB8_24010 [Kitasatospora sp. NPDC054939]
MRNGRLTAVGLDADAVHLAAAGLLRLAADGTADREADRSPGGAGSTGSTGESRGWLWQLRAASFADAWLAFGSRTASGLRVPADAVLRSLAVRAAGLVLTARGDSGPDALEWLGRTSAAARERAEREWTPHPAEPAALALLWHGIRALTAEGPNEREREEERITERHEAYVREHHHRQDTLALLLCCARTAAGALAELADGDPARADRLLEDGAARHMPGDGRAPLWVPGRPTH